MVSDFFKKRQKANDVTAETITDVDYADDLVLLASIPY